MEKVEHVQAPSPEPYRVKLERGQKGGYGWEISVSGSDMDRILRTISNTNKMLIATYMEAQ